METKRLQIRRQVRRLPVQAIGNDDLNQFSSRNGRSK